MGLIEAYWHYLRQNIGLNEAIGAGLIFGWWGIKRFKQARGLLTGKE